jgi:hypothetical protein
VPDGRKRFFLKKEAKTPAWLSRTSRRQPRKSFLVLFFKKEPLAFVAQPQAVSSLSDMRQNCCEVPDRYARNADKSAIPVAGPFLALTTTKLCRHCATAFESSARPGNDRQEFTREQRHFFFPRHGQGRHRLCRRR